MQHFIQQQQQNSYDMNDDMIPQAPYQLSPPPRPVSASSLSIQMQMMVEDLLYQQSQSAQPQNPLLSGFENVLFPVANAGGDNDDFRGSILGEDYPIVDN